MLPKPLTSLKGHPEIAQAVGLVVADYAVLESLMYAVFGSLSSLEPEQSIVQFYGLRSAHQRKELVMNAAATLDDDLQRALSRLWRRFMTAADRRTEIAHCLFLGNKDRPMRMRLHNGKIKYEPIDLALLERTFTQFNNLASDILVFLALGVGLTENGRTIIACLPLSPDYKTLVALTGSPTPPTQDEMDQIASYLSRLGLQHRFVG